VLVLNSGHGKGFVLQDFEISGHANPPVLGTEGPEFGIAEEEKKNSGEKKAEGPSKAMPVSHIR